MFIVAMIAFIFTSATQRYEFHIFTVIYSPLHGFIWKQHNDQLPVGLLSQLVEHCISITKVMGLNPEFFSGLIFYLNCSSSVHYSKDHFHIHSFINVYHFLNQYRKKNVQFMSSSVHSCIWYSLSWWRRKRAERKCKNQGQNINFT